MIAKMDEKEKKLQAITQEVAKWKGRAIEAAEQACYNCEEYTDRNENRCRKCRIKQIMEEAGK